MQGALMFALLLAASSAVASAGNPAGMRYIGCFVDTSSRDLPVLAGNADMSVSKCYGLCRARKFAYFGLQATRECWCGSSYGRFGRRPERECDRQCTGNKSDFCGAHLRNDVYTTGLSPPSAHQLKLTRCSQSSIGHWPGACTNAIDDNTSQNYFDKSCTFTKREFGWWKASTEKPAHITEVRIYNRLDMVSWRLNNFVITVDGQECASYHSGSSFSAMTFKCDKIGSEVMIKNRRMDVLTLCEVQVFGDFVIARPEFSYIGCFPDTRNSRDLPTLAKIDRSMTPGKCNSLCAKQGSDYFGLQAGVQCWCGDSYGSVGPANETGCGLACPGDGNDKRCGGRLFNAVFEVKQNVA